MPTTSRQTSATRTDTTSRLPISLGSTNKTYEPSTHLRPAAIVRHRAAAAAIGLRRPNLNIQRADYRGANLNVRAQEGPNGSSGDLKGGRHLGHFAKCWRKSSERLGLRFRRPYCAPHTSVSWNLMIGKNPLFVSRQHGHSVTTMWRTYAAWMDGALESDIALIQAAMNRDGSAVERMSSSQM